MELFLYGNPRYLSGCGGVNPSSRQMYDGAPPVVTGQPVTTEVLEGLRTSPDDTAETLMERAGVRLHSGKGGYHATPTYNNFLVDGQWPSAGVELETILSSRTGEFADNAVRDLVSNWFHFERDGSLDPEHGGTYGYELITEPLPPRVYRNPDTWTGLENAISPWLESFDHRETGLHVHVGLNQFADIDAIPIANKLSRMHVGKMMSLLVYYCLAGSALVDRITLRKNTNFCGEILSSLVFDGCERLTTGRMTGAEFVDLAVAKLIEADPSSWSSSLNMSLTSMDNPSVGTFCAINPDGTSGHGTEVNCEHRYTIEFRRGKGTCHALSIHRMVEFMTMVVRYAGKCCRNPGETVSSQAFLKFVHDNTTSAVLREMVGRKGGTACA